MPRVLKCECGACLTCYRRVYMRAWYRRPENTQRERDRLRRYREEHLEEARARDRDRGYRPGDATKRRARRLLDYAVSRGQIDRQPCEVCGSEQVQAHHDDYEKPLEVRWLCSTHHGVVHQRFNPSGVV